MSGFVLRRDPEKTRIEQPMVKQPVTINDIRSATRLSGLSGRPVCVHASLRSFGWVEGGAQSVADGLLAEGCTVLVFTLTWAFASPPPLGSRPARNGMDYIRDERHTAGGPVYSPDSQEAVFSIGPWYGYATNAGLVARVDQVGVRADSALPKSSAGWSDSASCEITLLPQPWGQVTRYTFRDAADRMLMLLTLAEGA